MPVWMLCLPVLFPILAGAVMLARPIEDRKKRQIYVAGAVIVNAVLALTVLIWTPDGVLTLLRFSDTMQKDHRNKGKRRTGQRINQVFFTGIPGPAVHRMHDQRQGRQR